MAGSSGARFASRSGSRCPNCGFLLAPLSVQCPMCNSRVPTLEPRVEAPRTAAPPPAPPAHPSPPEVAPVGRRLNAPPAPFRNDPASASPTGGEGGDDEPRERVVRRRRRGADQAGPVVAPIIGPAAVAAPVVEDPEDSGRRRLLLPAILLVLLAVIAVAVWFLFLRDAATSGSAGTGQAASTASSSPSPNSPNPSAEATTSVPSPAEPSATDTSSSAPASTMVGSDLSALPQPPVFDGSNVTTSTVAGQEPLPTVPESGVPAPGAPAGWSTYTDNEGRFTVSVPGSAPTLAAPGPLGSLPATGMTQELPGVGTLSVYVHPMAVPPGDPTDTLTMIAETSRLPASMVRTRASGTTAAGPSLDIESQDGTGTVQRGRWVLAGTSVYIVLMNTSGDDAAAATTFTSAANSLRPVVG